MFEIEDDFDKNTGIFSTEQSAVSVIPVEIENPVNPGVNWGKPVKKKAAERTLIFYDQMYE